MRSTEAIISPKIAPNWQQIADTWIEFATGDRPTRRAERRLATLVFTDIVNSTGNAAIAGDERWHRVLDRHDEIAWGLAERHGGAIVTSTGDGILARFDAPSVGVQFAIDFRRAMQDLDLTIRCGLHSGEIEVRENSDISGSAVNLASRIMDAADNGRIFVSSTVRELLLGGAQEFDDRGPHDLKGFDQPWRGVSAHELNTHRGQTCPNNGGGSRSAASSIAGSVGGPDDNPNPPAEPDSDTSGEVKAETSNSARG